MKLTLDFPDRVAELLAVLGPKGQPSENRVRFAVYDLIDHAQQGVYRPGSWERIWLTQAFGDDWTAQLEPGDPYGRPDCERMFTRPRRVREA